MTDTPRQPSDRQAATRQPSTRQLATGLIRKGLLRTLFSGAYLQRWNDKLRPCPLAELDKQAHKMIVAHLLWTRACASLPEDRHYALGCEIVEGALFDYFYRLVVTDIKPPVFYRIQARSEQYHQLTDYVFAELEPVLSPLQDFWQRFQRWHRDRDSFAMARPLLQAAHLFASQWEFRLIEPLNGFDAEMPGIAESFRKDLARLAKEVPGMDDILNPDTALARFANFSGQLRFQVRWTQLPRIPQTDVLGHMFLVAALACLYSLSIGACQARVVNNFFCGLFHDLPELLTRDIISPVKQSSDDLARLIRDCEAEELERRILGPLTLGGETCLVQRLRYLLGLANPQENLQENQQEAVAGESEDARVRSEFDQRILIHGQACRIASFEDLHARHNTDCDHPLDGQLVKVCDHLAAFLEADESICNGVATGNLQKARLRIADSLRDKKRVPDCLHMDSLLADFD